MLANAGSLRGGAPHNQQVGGGSGGGGLRSPPPPGRFFLSTSPDWLIFLLNPIINQCLATSLLKEKIVEVPRVEYQELLREVAVPEVQRVDKHVSKPVAKEPQMGVFEWVLLEDGNI